MSVENDVEAGHRHEDSVLQFKNLQFTVQAKDDNKKKYTKKLLTGVSGTVKSGSVLAVLGPSGAGKTVFINALTLNATSGGRVSGSVTLDGEKLSPKIMRERCFVVSQEDHHWPMLTCRETCAYAADLYVNKTPAEKKALVDNILAKMGLEVCADTRVGNEFIKGLSGGQKRRLSIAVALIKEPNALFLDEPTSGLDAAAAASIMTFIKELAQKDNLIIVASIHQPSAKVYEGFDQMMLLSKGRVAYNGPAKDAEAYFGAQGFETPSNMSAAEYFLDLVNADFTSDEDVGKVLDSWEGHKQNNQQEEDLEIVQQAPADEKSKVGIMTQCSVMLRRHTSIALRDPTLYLGRGLIFLFTNLFFSIIYIGQRQRDQDQVLNKVWLSIWFIGVPSNMGVVAVWAYNAEFKSIRREVKNGMVSPWAYLASTSLIQLPVMFIFALLALGIPAYAVGNFYAERLGIQILIFAACMYCWEAFAQTFSVVSANPLLGMMQFVNIWFSGFLFAGFLIPVSDIIWPFRTFAYILPLRYSVRAMIYNEYTDSTWQACDFTNPRQICYGDPLNNGTQSGDDVLDSLTNIMELFSSDNTIFGDTMVCVGIAVGFKIIHSILLVTHTYKSSTVHNPNSGKKAQVASF